MGNTQVTPIKPAIPPLINLAGKLDEGDDHRGRAKNMKYERSLDENKAPVAAVFVESLYSRPAINLT